MRTKQSQPAKYVRKRRHVRHSTEKLKEAYNAVKDGKFTQRQAAKYYKIPRSTLHDRLTGRLPLEGRSGHTLFPETLEKELVEHIVNSRSLGRRYTQGKIVSMASEIAIEEGLLEKGKLLTHGWYERFKKRWPQLSQDNSKKQRMGKFQPKSLTPIALTKYFNALKGVMEKYGFEDAPHCIYMLEECGINLDLEPGKVSIELRYKGPSSANGKATTSVSCIVCSNAAGVLVPPFVIFKGKLMYNDLSKGLTPGAQARLSENGWCSKTVFQDFIVSHFLQHVSSGGYKLVLYDGHSGHISQETVQFARDNKIILFVLPPLLSSVTAPMDESCFGPFKQIFCDEYFAFMRKSPGGRISRNELGELLCKAFSKGLQAANFIDKFKHTGIHPLDGSQVLFNGFAAPAMEGGDSNTSSSGNAFDSSAESDALSEFDEDSQQSAGDDDVSSEEMSVILKSEINSDDESPNPSCQNIVSDVKPDGSSSCQGQIRQDVSVRGDQISANRDCKDPLLAIKAMQPSGISGTFAAENLETMSVNKEDVLPVLKRECVPDKLVLESSVVKEELSDAFILKKECITVALKEGSVVEEISVVPLVPKKECITVMLEGSSINESMSSAPKPLHFTSRKQEHSSVRRKAGAWGGLDLLLKKKCLALNSDAKNSKTKQPQCMSDMKEKQGAKTTEERTFVIAETNHLSEEKSDFPQTNESRTENDFEHDPHTLASEEDKLDDAHFPGPSVCSRESRRKTAFINNYSNKDSSDEGEEEVCCVCKRCSPPAIAVRQDIAFVNWGQCDSCRHWVHLKYCVPVVAVRRNSRFYCPHCCKP